MHPHTLSKQITIVIAAAAIMLHAASALAHPGHRYDGPGIHAKLYLEYPLYTRHHWTQHHSHHWHHHHHLPRRHAHHTHVKPFKRHHKSIYRHQRGHGGQKRIIRKHFD